MVGYRPLLHACVVRLVLAANTARPHVSHGEFAVGLAERAQGAKGRKKEVEEAVCTQVVLLVDFVAEDANVEVS